MPRKTKPQTYIVSKTGCWEWQGGKNSLGYGRVTMTKKYAHREFYERFKGPIPEGTEVDHLCRNPGCVNPEHLETVSHAENLRRSSLGKMTASQVNAARKQFQKGRITQRKLAIKYGMSPSHMSRILTPVRRGHHVKLTDEQVLEIIRRYSMGGISSRKLGAEFGISGNHVTSLFHGKYRKDVMP